MNAILYVGRGDKESHIKAELDYVRLKQQNPDF